MMVSLVRYAKGRHFSMSHGCGKPWVSWLWFDAMLFAVARSYTLVSPKFRRWCRTVDQIFRERHGIEFSMVRDTGKDCWIDSYWGGDSPQDAVDSEVSYWGD